MGLRYFREEMLDRYIDESLEYFSSEPYRSGPFTTSMSGFYIHPTEPIERITIPTIESNSFSS